MRPVEDPVLDAQESLDRVLQESEKSSSDVLLVRLNSSGWTSVTKQDLLRMSGEGKGGFTLGSVVAARHIPYLHPDNSLDMALRYVDRWPLVPVVSRADFGKLEGVISQRDVL
jgi:CBS domain-containing protein